MDDSEGDGQGGAEYLDALPEDRLREQLAFVAELDRLKTVLRRTPLTDGSRRENAAEHSWHLAVMALILREHAGSEELDLPRVVRMLLVHDVVEIDAGDTYRYDREGMQDKRDRERRAARRLFGMLPDDQAQRMRNLWEEFEARRTPEARFAAALDRLQPLLHNFLTEGRSWREHGISMDRVVEQNRSIREGSPALWGHVRTLLERAVERGHLED